MPQIISQKRIIESYNTFVEKNPQLARKLGLLNNKNELIFLNPTGSCHGFGSAALLFAKNALNLPLSAREHFLDAHFYNALAFLAQLPSQEVISCPGFIRAYIDLVKMINVYQSSQKEKTRQKINMNWENSLSVSFPVKDLTDIFSLCHLSQYSLIEIKLAQHQMVIYRLNEKKDEFYFYDSNRELKLLPMKLSKIAVVMKEQLQKMGYNHCVSLTFNCYSQMGSEIISLEDVLNNFHAFLREPISIGQKEVLERLFGDYTLQQCCELDFVLSVKKEIITYDGSEQTLLRAIENYLERCAAKGIKNGAQVVEEVVARYGRDIYYKRTDRFDDFGLFNATFSQSLSALKQILQYADGKVSVVKANRLTPLMMSATYGDVSAIKLFCQNRFIFPLLNFPLLDQRTAVYIAVKHDQLEALRLLMNEGGNPNVGDNIQNSPLLLAVEKKNIHSLRILCEGKIAPNAQYLFFALQLAAEFQDYAEEVKAILTLLLEKGANPDAALPAVVYRDETEWVESLLTNGANPNLGLLAAVESNNPDMVNLFLASREANPNLLRNDGKSLLMYATEKNFEMVVGALCNDTRIALDQQFIVDGKTAVYFAVQFDRPHILSLLLEYGANREIPNNRGFTPLEYAQRYRQFHLEAILTKPVKSPRAKFPVALQKFFFNSANLALFFPTETDLTTDPRSPDPAEEEIESVEETLLAVAYKLGSLPNS